MPAAFAAGANRPDSFFCYEVWKKRAKRHFDLPTLGNRMHEEKDRRISAQPVPPRKKPPPGGVCPGLFKPLRRRHGGASLRVRHVPARPAPTRAPAGTATWRSRWTPPCTREDTGSALVPVNDVSPLPTGEELADITALLHTCLLEVYGVDVSVEYLADAFYHTKVLRGLFPTKIR